MQPAAWRAARPGAPGIVWETVDKIVGVSSHLPLIAHGVLRASVRRKSHRAYSISRLACCDGSQSGFRISTQHQLEEGDTH